MAACLGVRLPITIERRIRGAAEVGEHKTSMLQDRESGRPSEIDAMTGAVAEVARMLHVPAPHLETLLATVRMLDSNRHLVGRWLSLSVEFP